MAPTLSTNKNDRNLLLLLPRQKLISVRFVLFLFQDYWCPINVFGPSPNKYRKEIVREMRMILGNGPFVG